MNYELRKVLKEAEDKKTAIGHFNFAEITVLKAALKAAQELNVPIILGTSEKEADFIGRKEAAALIKIYKDKGVPVFLNADHAKSLEKIKESVEAGYDSVLFDGSDLPIEENIKKTKEVVEWVRSVKPDVVVEGEVGYIGSSSKMLDKIPEGVTVTSVEDAVRFIHETGVDMLAPAVGNIHGIVKTGEPNLNIDLIKSIKSAVGIPLVLHGASGNSNEDIKAAIKAGISIVHINTEVRVAWQEALVNFIKNHPTEIAPYNILSNEEEEVYKVIKEKLSLYSGLQ